MERKAIQVAHCAFKFRVAKLSMARLNKASSRTCLEICRRVRIAQVKLLKVLDRHPELLNEVRMTRLENAGWFTPSGFFSWRMSGIAGGMECHLKYWRQAIALLVEAWPEQAKVAGFKGQTPLMLVADRGNATLTQLLAPLSDVDAQDFKGRTALHAAVTGRSPECVALVLAQNPDVSKVTEWEENTALHTAVRFGVSENVRLILDEFPGLASKANAMGQTPVQMAEDILENLSRWWARMKHLLGVFTRPALLSKSSMGL